MISLIKLKDLFFHICRFSFLIYYLISIFFRVCFQPDLHFYQISPIFIAIDYFVDVFFLLEFIWCSRKKILDYLLLTPPVENVKKPRRNPQHVNNKIMYTELNSFSVNNNNNRSYCVGSSRWSSVLLFTDFFLSFTEIFPFEIIAYLSGVSRYYNYRCFRLVRVRSYFLYWNEIMMAVYDLPIRLSRPFQRFIFFLVTMGVVGHVFACGWYGLAVNVMLNGFSQSWLATDGLAHLDSNGTLVLTNSLGYRYLRAIYWSIQTLDTVGFGDIVAHSESETWYCILYFFISAFLIYSSIANLMTIVSELDAKKMKSIMKLSRYHQYALTRKLSNSISQRVKSYYDYQLSYINGFDEQEVISSLPSNIAQQVHHEMTRKLLENIDLFKNYNKGLLNALSDLMESYIFSPGDIIVAKDSKLSGAYFISLGQIEVCGANGEIIEILGEGKVFGLEALKKPCYAIEYYRAKSYIEMYYLRSSGYRYMLDLYKEKANEQGSSSLSSTRARFSAIIPQQYHSENIRVTGGRLQGPRRWASIYKSLETTLPSKDYHKKLAKAFIYQILQPQSTFREWWNNIIFFNLLFYLTSIALLLSGTFHSQFIEHFFILLIFSYLVDFFFFVDIIAQAFLFMEYDEGILLTNSQEIFRYFCKRHRTLWILSWLIPFDVILGFSIDIRLLPVFRLLKLRHLYRFVKVADDCIKSISSLFKIHFSFEFIRFITLYLLLFELCHWAGCIWLLSADLSTQYYHYTTSWKWEDRFHISGFAVNYDAFYAVGYTRSIYWAASVMSSIGFSDILPTNPVEYVMIILVMFFGYPMFNTLLGAIATMIGNFNRGKREFDLKVERIRDLMHITALPNSIETRTIRYYEYLWTRYEGVNEAEVLNSLPRTLKSDVIHQVVGPLFKKIPFFQTCSEPLEYFILEMFESRVFLHGDALMIAGDIGREMFIIEKGNVIVTSPDRTIIYARLSAGDYAGESSLLESKPRAASVYAVGYVDTYFITNEQFEKVRSKFPVEYHSILNFVEDTIAEKKQRNEALINQSNASIANVTAKNDINGFDLLPEDPENRASFLVTVEDEDDDARKQAIQFQLNNPRSSKFERFQAQLRYLRYIIPYHSFYRLIWDNIIFLVLLYFAIVIPLRITLVLPHSLYYIDYCFDGINIFDAYLHFNHFSVNALGKTLMKPREIRQHYFEYRFFVDLFVNLPYDLLAFIVLATNRGPLFWFIRAILRLPKMFKFFFLYNTYHPQVERASTMFLKMNPITYKITELTLSVVLIGLWVACAWYLFAEFKNDKCDGRINGFNCNYVGTWVEAQYHVGKLASNGSGQWTRLLRALNWAIPTLTSETMGDITGMNERESLFAFFVMFCGLTVNGAIIGFVVALVSDANSEITELYRKKEQLRSFLTLYQIPENLILAAEGYFAYLLTNEGSLVVSREKIFSELPHSLKVDVDKNLKVIPYLRSCPFFDFCTDEVLRKVAARLTLQLYVRNDKIIQEGDLGYEMFFLESGQVNVVSGDGKVIYATLEEGCFFGETALFFKTARAASIEVVSPFCVCMVLSKYDLDYELRSLQYDEEEVLQIFKSLQESNQRRNDAVSRNLRLAKLTSQKLHQLIPTQEKEQLQLTLIARLRRDWFAPDSAFRMIWDILGLVFLVYYIFSIPLFIAFLNSEKLQQSGLYIFYEIFVDIYWLFDIIGKAYFFSYQQDYISKKLVTDGEMIWLRYRSGTLLLDLASSIPIEILMAVPALSHSYFLPINMCRASHLLRASQLFRYTAMVEEHLKNFLQITFNRTTTLLLKAAFAYIVLTHWMACIFFIIHRYAEINFPVTYVTADNLAYFDPITGKHNICASRVTHCYSRSIYFVLGSMTSIGYGDVTPHTNNEIMWELVVAIVGAYIAAIFLTFIQTYQMDSDARHYTNYQSKLQEIEEFCKFRKLSPDLSALLTVQLTYQYFTHQIYHKPDDSDQAIAEFPEVMRKGSYLHQSQRNNASLISVQYRKENLLSLLSKPLKSEIYNQLHSEIINTVPVLRDACYIIKRRLASKLKSQFLLENHRVYSAGDTGKELFFVVTGEVEVRINKDVSTLDGFGLLSLPFLFYKQLSHSVYYTSGDHFGECCLLSKSGLRPDTATATMASELFYLEKDDLWEIFLYTPEEFRREFIHDLFTRVNENYFIQHELSPSLEKEIDTTDGPGGGSLGGNEQKVFRLFKLALDILHEIVETLPSIEDMVEQFAPKTDKDSQVRKKKRNSVSLASNPIGDTVVLIERSIRQLAGSFIKINPSDPSSELDQNTSNQEGSRLSMHKVASSLLRLPSFRTTINKVQDDGSSKVTAKENELYDLIETEEEKNYGKEIEELQLFIQQHQSYSHQELIKQQRQEKVAVGKVLRRAFSTESLHQRKRVLSDLSGDQSQSLSDTDRDKERSNSTSSRFLLGRDLGRSGSASRNSDMEYESRSSRIYSFLGGRVTGSNQDGEDEGEISEGSSDHSSIDFQEDVANAIAKRNSPATTMDQQLRFSPITKFIRKSLRSPKSESPIQVENLEDSTFPLSEVDLNPDPAQPENLIKEKREEESKNADRSFSLPSSTSTSFIRVPSLTSSPLIGNGSKDVLTSLSAVKVRKKSRQKKSGIAALSASNKGRSSPTQFLPIDPNRDRRHTSFVFGHPSHHIFDLPTNALEVMEILGEPFAPPSPYKSSPKRKHSILQTQRGNDGKSSFIETDADLLSLGEGTNKIKKNEGNVKKINFVEEVEKEVIIKESTNEHGHGQIEHEKNSGDENDSHHSFTSPKQRRRITLPEHVLFSNQKIIHDLKEKFVQHFQTKK